MPSWIKATWIVAMIVNAVSIVWFIIASSANFQRILNLPERMWLVAALVPSLGLIVYSAVLLSRGWVPPPAKGYTGLWIVIFILFYVGVSTLTGPYRAEGWLYDSIDHDNLKMTSDGNYEYRLELINWRQRNGRQQLYLRNVETGQDMYILVDIDIEELRGLAGGGPNWAYALLLPTEVPDQYEMVTTENLPYRDRNVRRFLIDIRAGTSRRIE